MKKLLVIFCVFGVSIKGLTAEGDYDKEQKDSASRTNLILFLSSVNSYCKKNKKLPPNINAKPAPNLPNGEPYYVNLDLGCEGVEDSLNNIKSSSAKDKCDDADIRTALKEAKEACNKAEGKKCAEDIGYYKNLCEANSSEINEELEKDEDEARDTDLLRKNFNACPHLAAKIMDPDEAKQTEKDIKDLEKSCKKEQRTAEDELQRLQKIQKENPLKSQNAQSQARTAGAMKLQELQNKIDEANSVIEKMQNVDVVAIANMVSNQDSDIDTTCGKELIKTAQESLKKYRTSAARGSSGLYSNYMPRVKADALVAYNTCVQVEGNKSAQTKRQANLELAKLQNMISAKVRERMAYTQQLNLLSTQMAKDVAQMNSDDRNANQELLINIQKLQQRALQDAQKCRLDLKKEYDKLSVVDISANIAESKDTLTRAQVSQFMLGDKDDDDYKKLKIKFSKKSEENYNNYTAKFDAYIVARDSFCYKCDKKPDWAGCGKDFNTKVESSSKTKH